MEEIKLRYRILTREKCQKWSPRSFPLAALNRRSAPQKTLSVQAGGRFPGSTGKVQSGKGLPRRPGGAVGRLIKHQGPFSSAEGSRSVLRALFSNRNRGGL